ncbi:MAG: hypothetical protein WC806_05120, partial [Candidatus Gracilibacteria bacterium]
MGNTFEGGSAPEAPKDKLKQEDYTQERANLSATFNKALLKRAPKDLTNNAILKGWKFEETITGNTNIYNVLLNQLQRQRKSKNPEKDALAIVAAVAAQNGSINRGRDRFNPNLEAGDKVDYANGILGITQTGFTKKGKGWYSTDLEEQFMPKDEEVDEEALELPLAPLPAAPKAAPAETPKNSDQAEKTGELEKFNQFVLNQWSSMDQKAYSTHSMARKAGIKVPIPAVDNEMMDYLLEDIQTYFKKNPALVIPEGTEIRLPFKVSMRIGDTVPYPNAAWVGFVKDKEGNPQARIRWTEDKKKGHFYPEYFNLKGAKISSEEPKPEDAKLAQGIPAKPNTVANIDTILLEETIPTAQLEKFEKKIKKYWENELSSRYGIHYRDGNLADPKSAIILPTAELDNCILADTLGEIQDIYNSAPSFIIKDNYEIELPFSVNDPNIAIFRGARPNKIWIIFKIKGNDLIATWTKDKKLPPADDDYCIIGPTRSEVSAPATSSVRR